MAAAAEPESPPVAAAEPESPAAEPLAAEPPAVAAVSLQEDRSASFAATDRGLDWNRAGGGTVDETFGDAMATEAPLRLFAIRDGLGLNPDSTSITALLVHLGLGSGSRLLS